MFNCATFAAFWDQDQGGQTLVFLFLSPVLCRTLFDEPALSNLPNSDKFCTHEEHWASSFVPELD